MDIYIKNMVCFRCKKVVELVLQGLEIDFVDIVLGKVTLAEEATIEQLRKINNALNPYRLELMEDRKKILVERIKILIIEMCNSHLEEKRPKFSDYLSKNLYYDYTYLANIFSEIEGSTIERFYIVSRIERVKELIVYEDLNIKEIAYQLNYSSVSHLCLQFKKVTGETPSSFKKMCESLDYVWRTCE